MNPATSLHVAHETIPDPSCHLVEVLANGNKVSTGALPRGLRRPPDQRDAFVGAYIVLGPDWRQLPVISVVFKAEHIDDDEQECILRIVWTHRNGSWRRREYREN